MDVSINRSSDSLHLVHYTSEGKLIDGGPSCMVVRGCHNSYHTSKLASAHARLGWKKYAARQ